MYTRFILILFLIGCVYSGNLYSQSSNSSTQLWTDFNYKYYPKSRLALGGQSGIRTDLGSPDWTSFYIVPEIDYRINQHFDIGGGIGLFQNWNSPAANRFETRFTQEGTANWPQFQRLVFSNRLRFDERFTTYKDNSESSVSTVKEWTYRLRYRLKAKSDYFNIGDKIKDFYVTADAEFFFPLQDKSVERFANRTRAAVGFGQLLPKNNRYEVNLILQQSINNIESNNKSNQYIIRLRYYLKTLSF